MTKRYKNQTAGILSCYDRSEFKGPTEIVLRQSDDQLFLSAPVHYARWAQPLRDAIREKARTLPGDSGIEIEFMRSNKSFRKQERVKEMLDKQGGAASAGVYIVGDGTRAAPPGPWCDKNREST